VVSTCMQPLCPPRRSRFVHQRTSGAAPTGKRTNFSNLTTASTGCHRMSLFANLHGAADMRKYRRIYHSIAGAAAALSACPPPCPPPAVSSLFPSELIAVSELKRTSFT